MNHYRNRRRIRREYIPLMILGGAAFVLLFGWIVMLLWNAILPDLVNVRQINIWQALGLLVLCKILFGSFGGKSGGWNRRKESAEWRQKWSNMTPEERIRFYDDWRRRCEPREEKNRGTDEQTNRGTDEQKNKEQGM